MNNIMTKEDLYKSIKQLKNQGCFDDNYKPLNNMQSMVIKTSKKLNTKSAKKITDVLYLSILKVQNENIYKNVLDILKEETNYKNEDNSDDYDIYYELVFLPYGKDTSKIIIEFWKINKSNNERILLSDKRKMTSPIKDSVNNVYNYFANNKVIKLVNNDKSKDLSTKMYHKYMKLIPERKYLNTIHGKKVIDKYYENKKHQYYYSVDIVTRKGKNIHESNFNSYEDALKFLKEITHNNYESIFDVGGHSFGANIHKINYNDDVIETYEFKDYKDIQSGNYKNKIEK